MNAWLKSGLYHRNGNESRFTLAALPVQPEPSVTHNLLRRAEPARVSDLIDGTGRQRQPQMRGGARRVMLPEFLSDRGQIKAQHRKQD